MTTEVPNSELMGLLVERRFQGFRFRNVAHNGVGEYTCVIEIDQDHEPEPEVWAVDGTELWLSEEAPKRSRGITASMLVITAMLIGGSVAYCFPTEPSDSFGYRQTFSTVINPDGYHYVFRSDDPLLQPGDRISRIGGCFVKKQAPDPVPRVRAVEAASSWLLVSRDGKPLSVFVQNRVADSTSFRVEPKKYILTQDDHHDLTASQSLDAMRSERERMVKTKGSDVSRQRQRLNEILNGKEANSRKDGGS